MYGDFVLIRDINGTTQVDCKFEDIYDDKFYCIIDKQSLGERIGRNLLDEEPDLDFEDNCHIIYEEIDKQIINDIVNDIFDYVLEYWNNNKEN